MALTDSTVLSLWYVRLGCCWLWPRWTPTTMSCLTHGMQGSQMWAHSALFGMDGLLMAFGGTHLVLLSMSRMPWDTEAEGSG